MALCMNRCWTLLHDCNAAAADFGFVVEISV